MTRYFKPAILIFCIFFSQIPSFGQDQSGAMAKIRDEFLRYCKEVPREELYIQTDRQEFIAGEDLWFNIFLIDRQSGKPSSNSELVYFELLNFDNNPVIRKRIKLEDGFGPGQIILPDSLSSGRYTIRAYTNWMKNFLPANCFTQKINIYNALSAKKFRERGELAGKSDKGTVNGPMQKESGISLEANNSKPDTLLLTVNTDQDFRMRNGISYLIFIQTHGIINYSGTISLTGSSTKIRLLKDILIPGINQIAIFDSKGNPLTERFIFTPVRKEEFLNISSTESYPKRTKIRVGLETVKQQIAGGGISRMAVSIVPEKSGLYAEDLSQYMVFGSEFGTIPEEVRSKGIEKMSAEYIDTFLSGLRSNWIDWKRIVKNEFPVIRYKMEKGEHYIYGKLVNSVSLLPDSAQYLFLSSPGKNAAFQYALTDSKGNFSLKIPISQVVQDIVIQPENITRKNVIKLESSFSEEYPGTVNLPDSAAKKIPEYIPKMSVNYQVSKIFGISCSGEPLSKPVPLPETIRFYGKPDIELIMDDYIKLPVMQEVFFELMPGVFLKNKKSVYEITILDPVDKRVYFTPPVLMVDGVVVHDASVIAGLDPELVERIDAVKERYFVGDYLFFGIVNVITRAGNFNAVPLPDYAIRMQYQVIDKVNQFISPDYSNASGQDEKIPDFRNTMYWNPSVITDLNGKTGIEFWSSDVKSKYVINIEGFTSDNRFISCRKLLKIE